MWTVHMDQLQCPFMHMLKNRNQFISFENEQRVIFLPLSLQDTSEWNPTPGFHNSKSLGGPKKSYLNVQGEILYFLYLIFKVSFYTYKGGFS